MDGRANGERAAKDDLEAEQFADYGLPPPSGCIDSTVADKAALAALYCDGRRAPLFSVPPPPVYAPADTSTVEVPSICVSPIDTLTVVLEHSVLVEISVSKNIRVCHIGSVAASVAAGGRIAALHHPAVEVIQEEADICGDLGDGSRFRISHDAVRMLPARHAPAPLLDDTDECARAQEMWTLSEGGGLTREADDTLDARFPRLPAGRDQSETAFCYEPAGNLLCFWPSKRERCADIARRATLYADWRERQSLSLVVHGVKIRQDLLTGDVRVYSGTRVFLSLRPRVGAVVARSPWVDMAVDRLRQVRVRRGDQFIRTTPQCLSIGCGAETKANFDAWGRLVRD